MQLCALFLISISKNFANALKKNFFFFNQKNVQKKLFYIKNYSSGSSPNTHRSGKNECGRKRYDWIVDLNFGFSWGLFYC